MERARRARSACRRAGFRRYWRHKESGDRQGAQARAPPGYGRRVQAEVLDFGSGTGRLSEWLVSRGARVTAVDATAEMVEVARRRAPEARHFRVDRLRTPFRPAAFDVVVTAYVLQYYV